VSADGRLELYQEYPQPGEEIVAQQLAEYLKYVVVAQKNFLSGATQRDVHGKSVAAIKAEFIVDVDVPREFRYGVFAQARWSTTASSEVAPVRS